MTETLKMQRAIQDILVWSSSEECPDWGRSLVQRSIALIDQIFIQRELGRYDAMKNV